MSPQPMIPAAGPARSPALRVRNLSVGFGRSGAEPVVSGISFEVAAGECLAIVGESGSGKSVTARTLLGLAGADARVQADEMSIAGASVLALSEAAWRRRRGQDVGLVLQDALSSLDPLRPVGREIADSLRLHTTLAPAERSRRVLELLDSVGLPDGELRSRQRSGELSGGQRQRALIASAIALDPPLLIADEPTTALDVTVQAQILELLERIKRSGTALILISHDLAVVSRIADRVAVMSNGRIVETGPTHEVLGRPRHAETRAMVAAVPAGKPRGTLLAAPRAAGPAAPATAAAAAAAASAATSAATATPRPARAAAPDIGPAIVLEATGLTKGFRMPGGTRLLAVDDVSFRLERGTTLGIVGESGSGKTTTARLVLALSAPDHGEVRVLGRPWSSVSEQDRRPLRTSVGAIYQDALGSFDPRLSVRDILRHAVALDGPRRPGTGRPALFGAHNGEAQARVAELLDRVRLSPALLDRRPLELSGGQRQRVGIARALASRPQILVCDEPVSALDVGVQAQVLDLLDELQRELALSLLFISHDLGVVQHVSDRVAVMNEGRIVEQADAPSVFASPTHPYTRRLLAAVPRLP
ncbi:ABC transporter ATP-binding protein [Cryobacterium sp. Sr8]|uniref:dipeptide ABC transporter ATP-binding protein n=1 Tax=Cryobacterium sp. Sr8 TaxID=1259203 RepID=UPI001F54820C|nr:ABC transporter ATP-binding protein [Cryobacterium sp. Sr8]